MRCFTLTCAVASLFSLSVTAEIQAQTPYSAGTQNPYAGRTPAYRQPGAFPQASAPQPGSASQQPSVYQKPSAYRQQPSYPQPNYRSSASYPQPSAYGQPNAYAQQNAVPQQLPLPKSQQPMSAYTSYGQAGRESSATATDQCGPACACGAHHGPSGMGQSSPYYAGPSHTGQPSPYQWASEQTDRWDAQRQAAYNMSHIPPEAIGKLPQGYSVARRASDIQRAAYNAEVSRTPPALPGNSIQQMQQPQPQPGDRVAKEPSMFQRVKTFFWPF